MKTFKTYITEGRSETDFLVDTVYSKYIEKYSKNQPECVGWLDGSKNALIRNQKIYEAGIEANDSVLDIGCGVAHLYEFLKMGGWNGKYLGIDPNKKAIEMIDENINAMHGTIEDLPDFMKYDWVIANGVFNLGLTENLTFSIIHNMISHAYKGIIFNMLQAPYPDSKYEAYYPDYVKNKLLKYENDRIEIIEDYMGDDAEFTVYFYVQGNE
jgi:SAM-dependent methyltransferase